MRHQRQVLSLIILTCCTVFSSYAGHSDLQQMAYNYVVKENPWLGSNQNSLYLFAERNSEAGSHFLFHQYHNGIRVYEGDVKINVNRKGEVLSIFSQLIPVLETLPLPQTAITEEVVYIRVNSQWQCATYKVELNNRNERTGVLRDVNGKVMSIRMLDRFARRDTTVQTKVFNPDPITSSGKIYGENGKYKNNNGADATELTAELKQVNVTLQWENDTFYTSSPYAVMVDMESPVQNIFKSTTASFEYTRSNVYFREMNCMYHLQKSREYYTSIGLPFTDMEPILVDPTAYQGMDQSRFSFYGSKRALYFGTGGVPDAEDADVIVHESTHGINNYIAPDTDNGSERLALEEANCDVMACLYSKNINQLNWRLVFNWDGHNEFWEGRSANSANTYPDDLSQDFYVSSLIWSSMLNDLSDDMGRDVVTRLLFTSVYSYANYMSMQEAADLLVQADSILYGKMHFATIKNRLRERGFTVSTGIQTMASSNAVKLLNTEGFCTRNEPITLMSAGKEFECHLMNTEGKEIYNTTSDQGIATVSSDKLKAGLYVLLIKDSEGKIANHKLLKQ